MKGDRGLKPRIVQTDKKDTKAPSNTSSFPIAQKHYFAMHISGWPRRSLDKNVTQLWLTNEQYYGEKKSHLFWYHERLTNWPKFTSNKKLIRLCSAKRCWDIVFSSFSKGVHLLSSSCDYFVR